jgi:Autophagocytosis associated protein, active-site domain
VQDGGNEDDVPDIDDLAIEEDEADEVGRTSCVEANRHSCWQHSGAYACVCCQPPTWPDEVVAAECAAHHVRRPALQAALPSTQDNIRRTRTYDLMISYDKFHAVPRTWLVGYDEDRQPLKPEQVQGSR